MYAVKSERTLTIQRKKTSLMLILKHPASTLLVEGFGADKKRRNHEKNI